jgi:histidyl-tRNA synthetase
LTAEGLPEPEPLTVLFVARADDAAATTATSFALSAAARRAGVPTQIELAGRSIKGQFKHADRVRARYVAAVSSSGIELKDFESGETTQFEDGDAALAAVLRGRGIS